MLAEKRLPLQRRDRPGLAPEFPHRSPVWSASLASCSCGQSLSLLDEQTGWYHVSVSGRDGYVGGARAVTPGAPVDCRNAVSYQVGDEVVTQVQTGCLSLRTAPSRDASYNQCVPNGTRYRITGGPVEVNGEDWLPVTNPSIGSGWVLAQFLLFNR